MQNSELVIIGETMNKCKIWSKSSANDQSQLGYYHCNRSMEKNREKMAKVMN